MPMTRTAYHALAAYYHTALTTHLHARHTGALGQGCAGCQALTQLLARVDARGGRTA